MSKHHHHDECCYPMTGYGMGGYGMGMSTGGYGGGYYGGAGCGGGGGAAWGIRWIYALLILIVIVLQFGRKEFNFPVRTNPCDEDGTVAAAGYGGLFGGGYGFESIDKSVLFIIVVFLLILCAGCWWGGYSGGTGCGGYGGTY